MADTHGRYTRHIHIAHSYSPKRKPNVYAYVYVYGACTMGVYRKPNVYACVCIRGVYHEDKPFRAGTTLNNIKGITHALAQTLQTLQYSH